MFDIHTMANPRSSLYFVWLFLGIKTEKYTKDINGNTGTSGTAGLLWAMTFNYEKLLMFIKNMVECRREFHPG